MLNWPIYVGFDILDLSKMLIDDFHYNYIRRKYPDSRLLFADKDFLTYQIPTDSVYKDFHADKNLFCFSWYEKKSLFYDDENKKVISKMNDVLKREIIEGSVGLRVKMYSVKTKKEEMKKAKIVKEKVVK